MSSLPQPPLENEIITAPARNENVVMGSQNAVSVLWRAVRGELYKIRHRTLLRVLAIIALAVLILGLALISLPSILVATESSSTFLPPSCNNVQSLDQQGTCLDHAPTQSDLAQAKQTQQNTLVSDTALLRPPNSIVLTVDIIKYVGLIILVIIAGTIMGGEYSIGTIRLMLTRGPTRTQFLWAKIVAILISVVVSVVVLTIIGVGETLLINFLLGMSQNVTILSATAILHVILYLLIAVLNLFIYAMLAVCLATLGKATAAGVVGALIWWFLESVIGGILSLIGSSYQGTVGDFLKAIPDYFIGNNLTALYNNQAQFFSSGQVTTTSTDLHALLVIAVYLVVFIGAAWWIIQTRDITN